MAWTGRSRGGYWGNWFFVQVVRWTGLWPAYLWLTLVAAYYLVAHRPSYQVSAEYLQRVFGPLPWWRRVLGVYRHFCAHGITLLDRLAVFMGRCRITCQFDGEEQFRPYFERGQGMILVGAHVGCSELGGHFLGRLGVPVNLVVIEREAASIRRLFDAALPDRRFRILTADDHPLRTLPILAALRRGEIVAMLADRSVGVGDVPVEFLGGTVPMPVGPYRLAAATGAPVFQVFIVRERLGQYRFLAHPPLHVSRRPLPGAADGPEACVGLFARRLEAVVRQYPFQWANFFAFWSQRGAGAAFRKNEAN